MAEAMLSSPLFGVLVSILFYEFGVFLQQKTHSPLANPLLIAGVCVIVFLKLTGISYETYNNGARFITMFLSPCTAVLTVNIYKSLPTIKKYLAPILAGTAAASAASMASVYLMCRAFGLNEETLRSLLPKSVTTAIALPLATLTGGIDAVLVAATTVTGILCAICAPVLIKLVRLKDPVAAGIAIGASGHAIGTSTALKLGEVQGATSGIAIAMCGLWTVLYYSLLFRV